MDTAKFDALGPIPMVAPSGGVVSGVPKLFGTLLGVPVKTAAAGETVAVATRGVFKVPKTTGAAWTVGAELYWDAADGEFTTDADTGTNLTKGYAQAAAASGDATGLVLLQNGC
jgi:predicted RecA/RadA family phage recombinase